MATYDYIKGPNGHKIQVESAKRDGAGKNIENNYAKQDGFYGTMGVGNAQVAKQIENVSEDVGSTQEEPFIFQGTATDNGLDSVETAPIAKHLEKQGNSVVVNQLVDKQASDVSGTYKNIQVTDNRDGTFKLNGTSDDAGNINIIKDIDLIDTHKYLVLIDNNVCFTNSQNFPTTKGSYVLTATSSATRRFNIFIASAGESFSNLTIRPLIIDLTQWGFTADEITDLTAHPEHFFNYYNGSLAYNIGTLVNSNGRYLKCIGRNQFNKDTVVRGKYIDSSGVEQTASTYSHSDFIEVIPNTVYHKKDLGSLAYISQILYYDKDKNFISYGSAYSGDNHLRQTTPNTRYVIINMLTSEIDTQVLSIYYEDGTDYNQYFPYEENTYDTGTEVLRSAGSVRDIKLPDGSITRNVGSYTFTGSETWSQSNNGYLTTQSAITSIIKKVSQNSDVGNLLCSLLVTTSASKLYNGSSTSGVAVDTNGSIWISSSDYSNVSSLTGKTIYFELATSTEEQGTSFAENVIVDNYGSMGWLDTDSNFVSVPQGSEFFYPADYVEFLDSLYTRSKDGGTSADVTNIVVQSELTSEETARTSQDTILRNAIGGVLKHCLCIKDTLTFEQTDLVDLGDQTWNYNEDGFFFATITGFDGSTSILCPKYGNASGNSYTYLQDKQIVGYGGTQYHRIAVKDTTYGTDYSAFKAAMKGVLLAYKKA